MPIQSCFCHFLKFFQTDSRCNYISNISSTCLSLTVTVSTLHFATRSFASNPFSLLLLLLSPSFASFNPFFLFLCFFLSPSFASFSSSYNYLLVSKLDPVTDFHSIPFISLSVSLSFPLLVGTDPCLYGVCKL